jgi:polyisoprenoid-binding protein YceI
MNRFAYGFALLAVAGCDEQKAPTTNTTSPVTTTTASAIVSAAATMTPSAMASAAMSAAMTAKPATPALPAADYAIDASHSQVGFSVRHMMVSNTKGNFKKFTGNVHLDEADLSKMSVDLDIETDSVDTADAKRDVHLKSPDFFDTKKFPKMTFKSTKVERSGDGYKVTGDLTIKDVKKSVELMVTDLSGESKDPWGNMRRGAQASAKLNRLDFGLKWNAALETGGVAVSEEVKLELAVELIKKKDAAAAGSTSASGSAKPAPSASAKK